ncbi:MAG: hypothetical protein WBX01_04650 [Nitrososphaeraceae archaeon]
MKSRYLFIVVAAMTVMLIGTTALANSNTVSAQILEPFNGIAAFNPFEFSFLSPNSAVLGFPLDTPGILSGQLPTPGILSGNVVQPPTVLGFNPNSPDAGIINTLGTTSNFGLIQFGTVLQTLSAFDTGNINQFSINNAMD